MRLPDGSYAPSWMTMRSSQERGEPVKTMTFGDTATRAGYVCAKHYPGEKGYEKRSTITYEVIVDLTDCGKSTQSVRVSDCTLSASLGSAADAGYFTLRCPNGYEGSKITKELVEQSSRVLVTYQDGNSATGIIVGALPNAKTVLEKKEQGHNSYESFNGIETRVNKDGEYILTFTGQTIGDKNQIIKVDEEKAGTFVKLTKEGNIVLSDTKGEIVTIDKASKKISIEARAIDQKVTEADWNITVKGNVNLVADGNVSVDSKKNVCIGGTSASENLMLGKKTLSALKGLVDIFLNAPIVGNLGSPQGPPVTLNPIIATMLAQWEAQNTIPTTSPLLAKKKFTE